MIQPIIKAIERRRKSDNYSPGRRTPLDMVVIHCTAAENVQGSINWLCKSDHENRSSAHYVIAKDGYAWQLVDENDTAWHAGKAEWKGNTDINARSVGIELENLNDGKDPYPEDQLNACLAIVLGACMRSGIKPENVVGHSDVSPDRKSDPYGFPWEQFRHALEQVLSRETV